MTNISVILVSGGHSSSSASTKAELLHTNGSWICSIPNLPYNRWLHTQTGVTACGSYGDSAARTTCHTLSSSGSWEESHSLDQPRWEHSAWASPQGTVLIGGTDSDAQTTSEILLENGDTESGFNLDFSTM